MSVYQEPNFEEYFSHLKHGNSGGNKEDRDDNDTQTYDPEELEEFLLKEYRPLELHEQEEEYSPQDAQNKEASEYEMPL